MVADDDAGIVDAVVAMLEFEGYAVDTTLEGEAVLTLNELPDLLLLDIWMSGTDGRNICRALRQQERTRHLPVIMFSASSKLKESAIAAGANDFLEKPFEFEALLASIRRFLPQKI